MKKQKGYRVYFEYSTENPKFFTTMKQARDYIREEAVRCGLSFNQALSMAFIMSEAEYQVFSEQWK